ncbi:MAG TPA: type IV pilus secretin PilQ [Terriglobales bacterium]|nr:type IV pilus secretin PilQ [Terriglobales bacterium]
MRKQLLGLIVALLAFVLIAAAADTPGEGMATTATLQRLEITRGQDGLRVEFQAKGAMAPKVTTLDSPARLVVDLPNTVMATGLSHIRVGSDGVKGIRVGMNGQVPPSTRVVVDLTTARQHELVTGQDGSFILKIQDAAVAKGQAAPAAKAETPKLVLASAPVAAEKSEAPAASVAFVEPKFTAKSDTANPMVEPTVRAKEAAGRFADKTAAELVAVNTHAAMKQEAAGASGQTIQPAVNLAAEQKAQMAQAPAANGSKYTGEPISVNLKDVDLKDFFRLIHEISGLNVVLDPNVKGTLTIVLDDVPWDQALDIVLKNNDLSRQLEGNILRIATVQTLKKEAENRRAQIDAEALAVDKVTITRFLSYAHSKDLVPTLKKFISKRGDLVADERTNSLVISDIPAALPQIDRLIQQMDRKTQEVEIEARVVAATRAFARDIGTQLGFGWGNGPSAVGGVQGVGTTPTLIGNTPNPLYIVTGSGSKGVQIPLFSNLGVTGPTSGLQFVNATNNMRIDILLTMAESRGLLKVLSRPRVVTQNNIQAVVKQGVRVPITTQAQLGGPPTVTYIDAFLRLTVTPQITSEGTIFLNVDVENTLPDFGTTVQGNPTLITQQATTQVLVTDGGTVVIGGVIQTQNSLAISQVPLLGDIPYLGNLFKHRAVKTSDQELIFFITPRIIQT